MPTPRPSRFYEHIDEEPDMFDEPEREEESDSYENSVYEESVYDETEMPPQVNMPRAFDTPESPSPPTPPEMRKGYVGPVIRDVAARHRVETIEQDPAWWRESADRAAWGDQTAAVQFGHALTSSRSNPPTSRGGRIAAPAPSTQSRPPSLPRVSPLGRLEEDLLHSRSSSVSRSSYHSSREDPPCEQDVRGRASAPSLHPSGEDAAAERGVRGRAPTPYPRAPSDDTAAEQGAGERMPTPVAHSRSETPVEGLSVPRRRMDIAAGFGTPQAGTTSEQNTGERPKRPLAARYQNPLDRAQRGPVPGQAAPQSDMGTGQNTAGNPHETATRQGAREAEEYVVRRGPNATHTRRDSGEEQSARPSRYQGAQRPPRPRHGRSRQGSADQTNEPASKEEDALASSTVVTRSTSQIVSPRPRRQTPQFLRQDSQPVSRHEMFPNYTEGPHDPGDSVAQNHATPRRKPLPDLPKTAQSSEMSTFGPGIPPAQVGTSQAGTTAGQNHAIRRKPVPGRAVPPPALSFQSAPHEERVPTPHPFAPTGQNTADRRDPAPASAQVVQLSEIGPIMPARNTARNEPAIRGRPARTLAPSYNSPYSAIRNRPPAPSYSAMMQNAAVPGRPAPTSAPSDRLFYPALASMPPSQRFTAPRPAPPVPGRPAPTSTQSAQSSTNTPGVLAPNASQQQESGPPDRPLPTRPRRSVPSSTPMANMPSAQADTIAGQNVRNDSSPSLLRRLRGMLSPPGRQSRQPSTLGTAMAASQGSDGATQGIPLTSNTTEPGTDRRWRTTLRTPDRTRPRPRMALGQSSTSSPSVPVPEPGGTATYSAWGDGTPVRSRPARRWLAKPPSAQPSPSERPIRRSQDGDPDSNSTRESAPLDPFLAPLLSLPDPLPVPPPPYLSRKHADLAERIDRTSKRTDSVKNPAKNFRKTTPDQSQGLARGEENVQSLQSRNESRVEEPSEIIGQQQYLQLQHSDLRRP